MLKKVMYIEDDTDILEIVKFIFDESPIEFYSYEKGAGAIEKVAEVNPDLLMLDMILPDIKGEELFAALQKNPKTAEIPVIFVTGKASSQELEAMKKLGPLGIINKPFDPLTLIKTVEALYKS